MTWAMATSGPFGSKLNRTPNLDRMAKEGMKLTTFDEMDADLGVISNGPGLRPADRVAHPQPLLRRIGTEYD